MAFKEAFASKKHLLFVAFSVSLSVAALVELALGEAEVAVVFCLVAVPLGIDAARKSPRESAK